MKISHHPASIETDITCTCGATVHTRSTVPNMRVAVCANCIPFFTGRHRWSTLRDGSRRSGKIQHAARLRPGERGMLHDVTTVRTCQYHHAHRPLGARGRSLRSPGGWKTERTTRHRIRQRWSRLFRKSNAVSQKRSIPRR